MSELASQTYPEDLEEADEITRWLQVNPTGETRRDSTLKMLRENPPGKFQELDLRGISIDNEDLTNLNFSGMDLTNADLSGANLTGANFSRSRLVGTSLTRADLTGCEFLGADLTGADFEECQGERAGFGVAQLCGASFFNAHLKGATFTKANLRDTNFVGANLHGSRMVEADLTNTNFAKANLSGVRLEMSDVHGADFRNADLREGRLHSIAHYDKATWIGTDINNVHFCGAYLVRRFIMDQNYVEEFRRHSRMNEYIYWIWWLTSDCGRSTLRWAMVTLMIIGFFAFAYTCVAVDYGDYPTSISPLYFSIVTLTTLGYGDATPASIPAQGLAVTEALLGYVMLGGLLSIFASKMARRAE